MILQRFPKSVVFLPVRRVAYATKSSPSSIMGLSLLEKDNLLETVIFDHVANSVELVYSIPSHWRTDRVFLDKEDPSRWVEIHSGESSRETVRRSISLSLMIHRHWATSCAAGIRAKWQQKWRISGFVVKGSTVLRCVCMCVCIRGLPVLDAEEGKEALGKLLSGVMGSGSCVASCSPSVILQLSLVNTSMISLSFLYAYPVHGSLSSHLRNIPLSSFLS